MSISTHAQNFNGQWKGSFTSLGSTETDEYVLELQVTSGTQVSGYSYTYFYVAGLRYFSICTVTGTIDRASKTITVTETEKIKGNPPLGFRDCLQTHILTYFNGPDGATLEGRWRPAPGFDKGCGQGFTSLSRRSLASLRGGARRDSLAATTPHRAAPRRDTVVVHKPTAKPAAPRPPVAHKPAAKPATPTDTPTLKMQTGDSPLAGAPPKVSAPVTPPPPQVRQRQDNVIQTIELTDPTIRIELYDDGIIDHDTVTVYFNGKAIIYKNMLTHQAIKATLTALPDRDNELILFADNLGDIPPNTALMIVHAGEEQYDVRVSTDLQNNGVVRFRLKPSKAK